MITIRIKTPKDYWKQLKEWSKMPRQRECKEIVNYYTTLLELNLDGKVPDEYADIIFKSINTSKIEVNKFIEDAYPMYNLPK